MERENTNGTRRQKLALVTAAALALSGAGWSGGAFGNDDPRTAEQPVESPSERAGEQAERAASGVDASAPAAAGNDIEAAGDGTGDNAQPLAEGVGEQSPQAREQPQQAGDTGAPAARPVPAPEIPQGVKAKEADDAEGIRRVLATSAQAAFTKGGFDDLVERLVDADRNRIGQNMPEGDRLETLNGRVAQIQKAWRDKYGEDFDMNEDNVFAPQFIGIAQGEVQDPTALARGWPVNPTGASGQSQAAAGSQPGERINSAEGAVRTGQTTTPAGAGGATATADGATDSARTASARTPAAAQEGGALGESRTEARNLEQGHDVALVRVPSSHGLPELTVSLIHEKPDMWRIDAPDHVRGQQLYDNLLNQLTRIGENAAQWPADKNDAYRYVSHCVLMAVLDVDAKQQGQQGQRQPQSQSQQSPSQQQ